jgi:hypothetical protein
MSKKKGIAYSQERWSTIAEAHRAAMPQVVSVLDDEDDFIELRLKFRSDGTTLAILKKYGDDGGPLVCFGTGYGTPGALLSLEASLTGNNWRVDKYANSTGN